MPPKTFTVAEANSLLPQVIPLVEQLQSLHRSIQQATKQLEDAVAKLSGGNGHPIQSPKEQIQELTSHQLTLVEAFQSALAQLQEVGGALKDLDLGLVDFQGLREGEVVFLCWKLGESRVQFWHTLESGYAAREPLE